MATRGLYLAAYDISDQRRLRAALHLVKGHATGGQKSMYECFLSDAEKRDLIADMNALVTDEDRFVLVRLDPRTTVRIRGIAVPPADGDFYYHG